MDGIIIIGMFVAAALIAAAAKPVSKDLAGMEDTPVSIDNIRRGVVKGWYTCTLMVVDGIPAVRLSGRTADGKNYSDVYPITAADWQTLQKEGYEVVS